MGDLMVEKKLYDYAGDHMMQQGIENRSRNTYWRNRRKGFF